MTRLSGPMSPPAPADRVVRRSRMADAVLVSGFALSAVLASAAAVVAALEAHRMGFVIAGGVAVWCLIFAVIAAAGATTEGCVRLYAAPCGHLVEWDLVVWRDGIARCPICTRRAEGGE